MTCSAFQRATGQTGGGWGVNSLLPCFWQCLPVGAGGNQWFFCAVFLWIMNNLFDCCWATSIPHCVCQYGLYCGVVEGHQHFYIEMIFPELSQEVQTLLCLLNSSRGVGRPLDPRKFQRLNREQQTRVYSVENFFQFQWSKRGNLLITWDKGDKFIERGVFPTGCRAHQMVSWGWKWCESCYGLLSHLMSTELNCGRFWNNLDNLDILDSALHCHHQSTREFLLKDCCLSLQESFTHLKNLWQGALKLFWRLEMEHCTNVAMLFLWFVSFSIHLSVIRTE